MLKKPGHDFSFSGLKTSVLLTWQASDQSAQTRADIAASFQEAVVDTLTVKVKRALASTGHKTVMVAGGVGANKRLREALEQMCQQSDARVYFPPMQFCTDNGAMIAYAGWLRLQRDGLTADYRAPVRARWSLEALN